MIPKLTGVLHCSDVTSHLVAAAKRRARQDRRTLIASDVGSNSNGETSNVLGELATSSVSYLVLVEAECRLHVHEPAATRSEQLEEHLAVKTKGFLHVRQKDHMCIRFPPLLTRYLRVLPSIDAHVTTMNDSPRPLRPYRTQPIQTTSR